MAEPAAIIEGRLAALETAVKEQEACLLVIQAQNSTIQDQQVALAALINELRQDVRGLAAVIPYSPANPQNPPIPQPDTLPTPPNPSPQPNREPKLQLPNRYDGEVGKCRGFLVQCMVAFRAQPTRYMTEDARVAFILSLLTGAALAWAEPLVRAEAPVMLNSSRLMDEMTLVFDHDITADEAGIRLTRLRQGARSVADFSIEFRSLAGETGWAEPPLITLFAAALSDPVKDELAAREKSDTLADLITKAIRIDNRIRERNREKHKPTPTVPRVAPLSSVPRSYESSRASPYKGGEPMEIGSSSLSEARRETRTREGLCYYCGQTGHLKRDCPKLAGKGQSR